MTPAELELVAASAARLEAVPAAFAAAFYGHLFEHAPEVRALFPADMSEQERKLVDEVVFLAEVASDLDGFVERARQLGSRHHGYGVRFPDYGSVGEALLHALAEVLGDDFTPEVSAAWQRLYRLVSETMAEGAATALFTPR